MSNQSAFNRPITTFLIGWVLALIIALTSACGGSSNSEAESSIQRVLAGERAYTIEDIESIKPSGVKIVKKYDVDELPGATDARNVIYNKLDYEVRFYATHEDAIEQGTLYADSITGDDAVVIGDEVLWEEGEKDRRKCSRAAGTPHSGCSYSARYLEYVIRGNMILFCEGDESSQAFENCNNLLALLEPV